MQVSVEEIGSIGRRLTITLPAEQLESAVASRLQRLSKQVKMPGFRPGKVPMKMVEAQYGSKVLEEAGGELIQTGYEQALGQEGLRPASNPKIAPKTLERGQALEFVVEFEVYPEVKQLTLEGQTIEKPIASTTETDVDRTIETLRRQQQTWQVVDREARLDDQLLIDFSGSIEGKPFDGGQGNDVPLVLGSGAMIKGFEEGLVGAKAGEKRTIDVTFPSDYNAAELAGKKTQFDILVKTVEQPQLPALDQDFVAKLGVVDGDMAKLRTDVMANLERERLARQRNLLRDRVLEAILAGNDLDVPEGLVAQEIIHMKQTTAQEQQAQGLPAMELEEGLYRDAAKRRVLLGLVMAEIIKRQHITADPDRVRARVDELAAGYESPDEVIRWYYDKPERLKAIESVVLEEKVVEALLETAEVKDQTMAFQDLVQASMAVN